MKKLLQTILILALILPTATFAARTDGVWNNLGTYMKPTAYSGLNVLIYGISKYLNFGSTSGTSGYGFRDNSGIIEHKDSGGSWSNFSSSTQKTISGDIWFTGLTNCDTIDTDAYGLLSCGTDASGSGGTGSNWQYDTNYGADALTPTSTIPVWFKDAVYATSTIHASGNITGANLNISNWDTAHGWGDHSGVYDILGQATSTLASHTTTYNHANYDTAYGWSNHADAGYNLQAFASSTYAIAGGAFHDGFSDFVANEHLDWTQNVGTIHAGNYTDTNTTYTSSDFTHDDLTGFVANEHLDWTSNVGTIDTGNYIEDVPHASISALNALFTSETVASTTQTWADAYINSASTWNAKMDTTDIDTIAEINAILSTESVASTTNVWADSYISSASTWNAKWDALTDMVLTDNYIYVGDASNDPVGVALSNDCTIASNGAITCDHDALDNFVANEHLDWTTDLGATNIHSGNYTAGLTNLTDFNQTAWRLFYSDSLGNVVELSLGTDGQYLKSQGGTSTLTWGTPIDTNANTICAGGTTYLDGEGNCDDISSVYQPLEATLTDIADGTIGENLVNTANPWADNEVSDTLTVTGYMQDTDIDTLAELNAWLIGESVASTTQVWADAYVSNTLTVDNYMQDTDIDTFAELQSWAVGYTDNNTTYVSSDFTLSDITGYVANEHLDWTGDLGAVNIHAGNYTDTNTTYLGGTNLTLVDTTFNVDDAFLINSGSDIAGAGSGFTWGFNASAGSDPVMTFGDGIINVTTGALQVGGAAVQTGADLVDDAIASCANANSCTLTADAITDNLILLADFAHSQDYGDFTIGAGESFTLDTGTVADNEIDYANVTLADFDYQTAWRVFYSNTSGDVTELALGADGTYLKSNGAAAAPTFEAPAGGGDITQVFDCATGDCNTMTVGTSEYLTYGTGYIDANRFAGVTTVDATEFGYLNNVSSAIQTQFSGKQGTLTNSAGLRGALSDETGTGVAVFGTAPSVNFDGGVLEIPQDDTTDAVGEMQFDTTDTVLVIHDGTANRVFGDDIYQTNFTVYADAAWDSEAVPIWIAPKDYAITIVQVHAACMGSTPILTYNIEERAKAGLASAGTDIYAADQTADANGEDETSFSNAGIAAGAHLVLTTGASSESGTVDLITE